MTKHAQPRQQSQRGVAAIEFALVFTVVFALLWSMVCYVAPLIVLQGLHRASAEGARVAALFNKPADRETQAKLAAEKELEEIPIRWLGGTRSGLVNTTCTPEDPDDSSNNRCLLIVSVSISSYNTKAPLRPFSLPGIGQVPALPHNLTSEIQLQLN